MQDNLSAARRGADLYRRLRSGIDAIEARGGERALPPRAVRPYRKAKTTLMQVETQLQQVGTSLDFPFLLFALPAVGALLFFGIRSMGAVTEAIERKAPEIVAEIVSASKFVTWAAAIVGVLMIAGVGMPGVRRALSLGATTQRKRKPARLRLVG